MQFEEPTSELGVKWINTSDCNSILIKCNYIIYRCIIAYNNKINSSTEFVTDFSGCDGVLRGISAKLRFACQYAMVYRAESQQSSRNFFHSSPT